MIVSGKLMFRIKQYYFNLYTVHLGVITINIAKHNDYCKFN